MLRSFSVFGFVFLALAAIALKATPKTPPLEPRLNNDMPTNAGHRQLVLLSERALPFHARFSLN